MKRMKLVIASSLLLLSVVFAPLALPQTAGALNLLDKPCTGSGSEICGDKSNNGVKDIQKAINLLLYLIGVIAVIVIVVGGIKFVTSDGDSAKIKSARETILYAVVGLVVALLAFAIVQFVVSRFK